MAYKAADFKALCLDYRIEWEVESQNGVHRLGLTFAQLKFDLAMKMLGQVLNETRYLAKDLLQWRKKEIYHYNYYKNDPDSMLKWWANGQEQYYKTLNKMPFENSNGALYAILGRPQVISSVGRLNDIFIKQNLFKIVRTKNKTWTYPTVIAAENERRRNSSFSYSAIKIWNKNPIQANYIFDKYKVNAYNHIESEGFSLSGNIGYFCFEKDFAPKMELLNTEIDAVLFYKERALINYYLWLEYNKNEALANAYFSLGIWENDIVEKFKNSQVDDSVISNFIIKN